MIHFISGKPKIFWNLIKENVLFDIKIWNINFKKKTNKTKIDDKIIGENKNLVIKLEPIISVLNNIKNNSKTKNIEIIYLSPQGKKLSQNVLKKISIKKELIFISGKNRGVDNRIIENLTNKEISLGDFILNCGEFAFIILVNSINRIIVDFNSLNYIKNDSFENSLFDIPIYSKPFKIKNFTISRHFCFKKIQFEKKFIFLKTFLYRPDLKSENNYEEFIN